MDVRKMSTALIAATALVMPTATASAGTIGQANARGDFATAIANGEADRPRWLKVTITTSPRQRATGNYTVICTKGWGSGSKSGSLSGWGKFTRWLKMPMRGSDNCMVSALGSLDRGGHIRVVLSAG